MGASRKLQGEIDRVLKKVQEGVDVFDSIWNKVYDTENANQKEKFEADLKKEIKKLQRYRDQIKTWIQSSEIKDKKVSASYEQALLDARKLIEREMERFKICEKETKTKAFSKEGLGQQPKTDPKEKAKAETRDWLNNAVSELESQIDCFEADIEGLSVKKGKSKPPRLTHLEESISRHKAHIVKLELILRLLDNDELSPEQVNDVKDFVDDYVDRNQADFEDFEDVDDLYNTLPLDKVEGLEDLVTIVPPAVVVKEKAVVAAAAGAPAVNGTSLKVSVAGTATQPTGSPSSVTPQGSSTQDQVDDTASQDSNSDVRPRTPPSATIANAVVSVSSASSSGASSGTNVVMTPGLVGSTVLARGLGGASASALLAGPGSNTIRGVAEISTTAIPSIPSSPISIVNSTKEDDSGSFAGRRVIPEVGTARGVGRGSVVSGVGSGQTAPLVTPLNLGGAAHSGSGLGPDIPKRTGLAGDERVGGGGLAQQLASPLAGQSRVYLQQGAKLLDGTVTNDSNNVPEGGIIGARIFNPSSVPGSQWRPPSGNSFQNQTEMGPLSSPGPYRGRAEIAPDQREKFLQRLHQVQQQGHNAALLGAQLSHLSGANPKQFSSQQQPTLLQQAQLQLLQQQHQQQQGTLLQNSQSSSLQQQQVGLGLGLQSQSMSAANSPSQQHQQVQSSGAQSAAQQVLATSLTSKDNDISTSKIEEQQLQQQQQKLADDSNIETTANSGILRNFVNEDDLKNSYTFDVPVGGPGSLAELSQLSKDADLAPGQPVHPVQSSLVHGVIGRRSGSDLGAIGDNLVGSIGSPGVHDHIYSHQMLEAAFSDLPQPKDSERLRSYVPKHPAVTPASYPQAQAPIIDNPLFWDRLDPDALFFAFYYQQNTYQQYLAARELKKQSWRYHRKYNTWFQRHEEPKVTTDEYEQGTYVYFDFHILHDDYQQGWCQRIKTEFTFEYSYLEDELVV